MKPPTDPGMVNPYKGTLFDAPTPSAEAACRADITENRSLRLCAGGGDVEKDHAFQANHWINTHPKVYALFVRFAGEKAMKNQRFGMKALAERIRWEFPAAAMGDDYYINNNYVAYIGRRLVQDFPIYAEYIEFRTVKGDE